MSDKLKPCPFCGSENLSIEHDIEDAFVAWIHCLNCRCEGKYVHSDAIDKAITLAKDSWNIRTQKDVSLDYEKLKEVETLIKLSFGQMYPHPELIRMQRLVSEIMEVGNGAR